MHLGRSKYSLLLLVLLASGCSIFSADDELKPAKLQNIDVQVELTRQWKKGTPSNNNEFWANLEIGSDDSALYIADHSGSVVSLDVATGKQLWQIELDSSISGGVGYGGNKVLLGTIEGQVLALNAQDGELLWSAKVSSEVLSSPAADENIVVAQTIDNKIYALDASTGTELWQHDTGAPILSVRGNSSAVILNNMLIAAFDNGKLIAFNSENGSLKWETRLALPKGKTELERMIDIDGKPLVVGDIVYSVSYQGRLGALTRGTGRNLWLQDSSSHFSPAYNEGMLFVTEAKDDSISAFKAGNGVLSWKNDQLVHRELTGPASLSGNVAVADAEGYVHLISSVDGSFVGRKKIDGSGVSSPLLVVGESLIIQANNGSVGAYKIQ
jgi:outer membrane protein assembly factor BamB